jgi:hypothetical protein
MVLYCISHTAFFAWAITRHLTAHSDEELAIMGRLSAEKAPIYTDSIRFIYADNNLPGRGLAEIGDIKAEIIKYYDALFEKAEVDIRSLSEIYLIFDSLMAVNLYFAFKDIPCVLIEAYANHSNSVSGWNGWRLADLNDDNYRELYLEYGWGKLKKRLYHPATTQFNGEPPYEYFDYFETLKNTTAEKKEKLLSLFRFDKKSLENKTLSVFFPNSHHILGNSLNIRNQVQKWEQLYCIHIQYFLDFYGDDSVAYKAHPGSTGLKYNTDDYISNPIIPYECLSELLPHIKGFVLENVYGMASTSLDSLSPFAKRVYRLGVEYFHYFLNLPSVQFLLFLADARKLYNLFAQNIDFDQIKKYTEIAFPELAKGLSETPSKAENSFQIINMREVMKEHIDKQIPIFNAVTHLHYKSAALALINFDYKGLFDDSLFNCGFINKFCLLVKIEKTQVKPKILVDLNEEYILLYVRDAALRSEILKTNVDKVLPNTGVKRIYKVFVLSEVRTPVLEFKTGGGVRRLRLKRRWPQGRTQRGTEEVV